MATEDTDPSPELQGLCRAEQGVFGDPGTLQEPENSRRPCTQPLQ